MEEDESISLKIILLGESTVGKTSIILRGQDPNESLPNLQQRTRIIGNYAKKMTVGHIHVTLNMIDTVGTEKFRSTNPSLFPNTRAGILVYDLSVKNTLFELKYWYSQLKDYCPNVPIIVVGNKSDLKRTVKQCDVDKILGEMEIADYVETSAFNNTNIPELYAKVAKLAYDKSSSTGKNNEPKTHFKLSSEKVKPKSKKKCC